MCEAENFNRETETYRLYQTMPSQVSDLCNTVIFMCAIVAISGSHNLKTEKNSILIQQ
jgi:hypothetical protein